MVGILLLGGGVLIGFLLSVLGAGGSILLLPLLVCGAALPSREAVSLSLLMGVLLALANLGPALRRGQIAARPALLLGSPALVGTSLGASWVRSGFISEGLQLAIFAAAALVASWMLLSQRTGTPPSPHGSRRASARGGQAALSLAFQGLAVGLLTGIAGVGGGFAIVPALVLFAGLPMALASGTSLLLIAVNGLVALTALGNWPHASPNLVLPLLVGAAIGTIGGQKLAPHLSDRRLRQGFAMLLIGSALLTGGEAWHRQQALHQQAQDSRSKSAASTHSPGHGPGGV